ncbi:FAD-dependent monooxygenase [Streptomyces sp. NPDC055239]
MRVVVVGAGPAGCAAAIASARAGAEVCVLDSGERGHAQMAGEWLHPAGADALARLGIGPPSSAVRNKGLLVHVGPHAEPLELRYARGPAVSMPHANLVKHLRTAAAHHAHLAIGPEYRVLAADRNGTLTTAAGTTRTDLVVGADGRASAVRRALGDNRPPTVSLSRFAGFVVRGAVLPREGFGHVFMGGPGPALAYRLDADSIRVFLDVPLGQPSAPAVYAFLRRYVPQLPHPLRDHLSAEIEAHRVHWAANRFQRRTRYRQGRCIFVGDAVGYSHPLAAHGMSAALLDGEALGQCPSPADYARHRAATSWVSEQVSVLVHRAFCRRDSASIALRDTLFRTWRSSPAASARAMALLGMQSTTLHAFGTEFARLTAMGLRTGHPLSTLSWLDGMVRPQPALALA